MQKCHFSNRYDRLMAPLEKAALGEKRRELLAGLRGAVLEVGSGTGVNLGHFPRQVKLISTDPDSSMYSIQREKLPSSSEHIFLPAAAEAIPFAPDSFDFVVITLALCSVSHPGRALAECSRVLRQGGKLVFIEHVRSRGRAGRFQDLLQPAWTFLSSGCHPNRRSIEAIQSAGFQLDSHEVFDPFSSFPRVARFFLRIVQPFVVGQATKA